MRKMAHGVKYTFVDPVIEEHINGKTKLVEIPAVHSDICSTFAVPTHPPPQPLIRLYPHEDRNFTTGIDDLFYPRHGPNVPKLDQKSQDIIQQLTNSVALMDTVGDDEPVSHYFHISLV